MSQVYPVSAAVSARALIDASGYDKMYARSVADNEGFWAEQAQRIDWIKPFSKVKTFPLPKTTCIFAGTRMARSTFATTASIGTWKPKQTMSP